MATAASHSHKETLDGAQSPGGLGSSRPALAAQPALLAVAVRRHRFVSEVQAGLRRCGVLTRLDAAPHPATKRAKPDSSIKIVIGVSGGADSVSLLLACLAISKRRRLAAQAIQPIAAHVHHHLRESADADAQWVQNLCHTFGIELHTAHIQPGELPGNVSSNARRLRYQALANIARCVGARYVAVAHHAEDQLETMLIALCRGAGLDGLAGMPWSRPLEQTFAPNAGTTGDADALHLVRPLLAMRKRQCQEFCRVAGVQWREDPTNVDLSKRRARLRQDVLPVLEELWPQAPRRAAATAEVLDAARSALQKQLAEVFGDPQQHQWDRMAVARLEVGVIAAGLRRAAIRLCPCIADELNHRHLQRVAQAIVSPERRPRIFNWPGGLTVSITAKRVMLQPGPASPPVDHHA
jgi:tRNA(Ile)-lysidine synthetase-like protein